MNNHIIQYIPRNFTSYKSNDNYKKDNNDLLTNMDNKIKFIKNKICDGQRCVITYMMFQDYLDKIYNDDTQILIERMIAFHENNYKQNYDEINIVDMKNLINMDSNYSFQILAMIGFEIIKEKIIDMYYFGEKDEDYKCCIYNKNFDIIYHTS